ncbi:tetratricopeptide repeat protein [Undibacterium sp. CY18W]|uniref:Tetratricopeptide repeat protein n=1 Tax=Undibacterium hunanense TaxID=2762292 RepID=A0ABR6ZT64_9BURK|nr:tetratricopeptide repeat protein [Undibacterium hunanense]MBC3919071.1 tetratricopeptide repeat protein [Undibacterium hunanense]
METTEQEPTTQATPASGFVVEQNQRLSASLLWGLQRRFFSEQSIDAWRNSIVPHYITSNTFIARAYARLVFAYLRDLLRDQQRPLGLSQSLYVLELGAGSGRFSYHFIKKFFTVWQQSALSHIPVCYVMSDFCEKNLAFWRQHPFLQNYIQQGWLDFALVDMSKTEDIVLQHSGVTLSQAQLNNPLVVIANYVFDSIEQDAFYVNDGTLHESLVSLHSQQPEPDINDVTLLQRVQARWHDVPVAGDYYPEPEFNLILAHYRQHLADSHVLLPVQSLRYLTHLRHISHNRLLLISADKGYGREDDLRFRGAPGLVSHGSISLSVNYHAIAQYVDQQGGLWMSTPQRHQDLYICAAVFAGAPLHAAGQNPAQFVETQQAFTEHISDIGPDDFFSFKRLIQAHADSLEMEQILAYLRMSGWDATNFWGCYIALMQHATTLVGPLKREVADMAAQVWHNYYPLGEVRDLAFALGSLLYEIEYYPEAITYLEQSLSLYGKASPTLYNLGMCHYNLGQLSQALQYVNDALQLDPDYEPACVMLTAIENEIQQNAEKRNEIK